MARPVRGIGAAVLVALVAAAPANARSLYSGPSPRPGPDLLYAKAARAPQLTNRAPWRAAPILVSGSSAYRSGEFLYQDFLYDDSGAKQVSDPNDPRSAGNLFSRPNGTYTYPTDRRYASNAADLVEFRIKPQKAATAFRVTLNTLKQQSLVAFTIAIGGKTGQAQPFPFGANVKAPADYFLTVHPRGSKLVADLRRAGAAKPVAGRAPRVRVDMRRRQIEVDVAHRQWNPRRGKVRLAMGVGLWDAAANAYLLPQGGADATHPGGAGAASAPAAFFNVAFRFNEPIQKTTESNAVVTDPAWWRDRLQGNALAAGDISQFFATVDFRKLARKVRDERGVPRTGVMDRIMGTHFEVAQGADFSQACLTAAATCNGEYQGRLQPYAIYVPSKPRPRSGYGMTLLMHSLGAMYNQYAGTRNMTEFGDRGHGSIVITTESRGPDENYENYGAADVFDAWAEVARRYRLDPSWTTISGYSMGGVGTFKLGSQFPDLFARAQPTVGFETSNNVLASLRNVPVLMWNNMGDELANQALYTATAAQLDSLGYRYELNEFQPCANAMCSPVFPNHLQLAINDQYQPAADFLGTTEVNRDPAHVTYVLFPQRSHANLQLVADHAYWVSGLKMGGDSASSGQIDAISHGRGVVDPTPSSTQVGAGTLTGGNMGDLQFTRRYRTWSNPAPGPKSDSLDITATNISAATIAVKRAGLTCQAKVNITSDVPLTVTLAGCNRTVKGGG